MTCRSEAAADRPAIDAILKQGFPGHPVAELVEALRASADWLGLGFVAEAEGVVAGYVALSRGLLDRRDRLVEVLILSPLAVASEHQGQGLAGALIARALKAASATGAPAVYLEGDPAFYGRHGFSPAGAEGTRRPSLRIPGPAFQLCRLDPLASLEGTLVYPRAFWDFDSVGLRDPDLARIEAALA